MRTSLSLVILSLVAFAVSYQCQQARRLDPGGESEISSSDPQRAAKAIGKWSRPSTKEGRDPLSGPPVYWDFSTVGRPVFLRIIKNHNRGGVLELWTEHSGTGRFELTRSYRIASYSGKLGPKLREGDRQAPEGFYHITRGRMNPRSSYHLSMDMGYPNAFDRAKGRTGSYLMIHGSTVSIGCYAMTDRSIEQIYTMVHQAMAKGQRFVRVHAFPFPMTDANLEKRRDSEHFEFWRNLKEGWDWFEEKRQPPEVGVREGRYVFSGG